MSEMQTPSGRLVRSLTVFLVATGLTACGWLYVPEETEQTAQAPVAAPAPARAPAPAAQPVYSEPVTSSNPVRLRANHPDRHVVVRGDTLWDLSGLFLEDPWLWPEIWHVNPQIANPHLIYPGDILNLVYVDGRPQLRLERAGAGRERLSPAVRVEPLENAIRSIPFGMIAPFISKPSVLDKRTAENAPYVLAIRESHLIAGKDFGVFVRGTDAIEGTRFNVYHIGEKYRDPDTGEVLGYAALHAGQGRITQSGDPATMYLTESRREVLAGDRLVLEETELPLNFFPKAPAQEVDGKIVAVVDGLSMVGQYQVVVLNRGMRHGLEPGSVLSIWQAGEYVRDRFGKKGLVGSTFSLGRGKRVKLPEQQAGRLMVFRSLDAISFALIMSATSEIQVADSVRNPQ